MFSVFEIIAFESVAVNVLPNSPKVSEVTKVDIFELTLS